MQYYSTNKQAPDVTLEEAVVKGLAADKGLFMPFTIKPLPQEFYDSIDTLGFQEIAYRVADAFFGEDVPADTLKQIVYDTLSFDVPLVKVTENIYSLELFHGPTLAFKDVGGRFMARLLGYFIRKEGKKQVNVLVATSGDTGSAVANGFLGVEGIHVYVLYPNGQGQWKSSGKAIHYVRDRISALLKWMARRRLSGIGESGFHGSRKLNSRFATYQRQLH